MAIQSHQALTLDALSILTDVPPNPAQPVLKAGVHLRWFLGEDRSFPLKGGYYLFRRRVKLSDAPLCVMPRLKDRDPAVVASQSSIGTGIGTLAANDGQFLKPRSIGPPGTLGVAAFTLDRPGLRFSLPAGTTTRAFTVRLLFASVPSAGRAVQPQVGVVIYRGTTIVTRRIVVPPPDQQDITIGVEQPGADGIQISGAAAELVELCYAMVPTNHPIVPTGTSTTAIPGPGWEIIPDLNSVIKLPLNHPQYPASPGPESISASKAIASARVYYDAWQNSFDAGTLTQGTGTIALTTGSPIVAGAGTNWTADLVGSLIRLPLAAGDYTAYAIMAVLAPDLMVLSRSYSGNSHNNAAYQLAVGDDFAELHDRVASLLQSPNDMRAATVPPPLDRGTVGGGKCVLVSASAQVIGMGTQWTASLAGCWIEIGPAWFQSTHLAGSNIYRIAAVGAATQLTLDRPFAGVPYFVPTAKCDYRIFARAAGDDPTSDAPTFDFKPMDLLELASLMPSYAQALGLYGIDTKVSKGDIFDYIVIFDRENHFSQQIGDALSWLNGTPDFTGDALDGFIKLGVHHSGSPPLPPPTQLELFRLPTAGARISIAYPDRADSDAGLSVLNAASWADPNATQVMPVMLNLSRLYRGTDQTNLTPVGSNAAGYDDLGRLLPSRRDSANAPNPPAGWPADPIHFIDSGSDRSGLDVGWYSYRAYAIDLYGRFSPDTAPIPWKDIDSSAATVVDAIHLADTTPPPPPAGVLAWIVDDRDPYVVRDAAFKQWRGQFAPSPMVGLRLNFRWPWSHQSQGPDLREFRVYFLENPINARTGRVTSVSPVSGQPTRSLVTLDLDLPDNTAADDYQGASLQAGNRAFTILLSQSTTTNQVTSVQLTVENGGPSKTMVPESKVNGAIVIPSGHPLHKELLHPGNWKWLAAIPENLPATQYDIEMVEDSAATPFDAEINTFVGAQAMWNGTAWVLDAIPASHQLTSVRPGIDVLALSSDEPPYYYVMDIQNVQVSGLRVVPRHLPDPVPLPTTSFAWRIGPANAGLRGLAASWNATTRRFSLDGTPDLSNVTPGADLVYIAAAGATPANLDFFFAIQSLDDASRVLTLENSVHLNALPDGASFAWQVGRPVRSYEIFLPDPSVPQVEVTTDPSIQLGPVFNLLTPSLNEPVRHGTIGVSSADKRHEVADRYWPLRGRTGNESFVSGPAPVFRVLRDPPPAPTYTWNATRLLATRANYHDKSFFTMRWDDPGAGYHAHVFRAMDSSLFLAHWNLNGSIPLAGAPPGISVLSGFDARKTNFNTHAAAAAAAAAQSNNHDATFQAESALAGIEYREAAKLYDHLDDTTLLWLAARPELADAYMQVTIKPLDLSDPANADRLGPDNDPTTFTASPTVRAYIDMLPGKSTNKYFYAAMLLDGAQNRSALGNPTPPVYLPKVVPPNSPVVTKIFGGERQIELHWLKSREADLAGYRIYRSADADKACDIRSMELAIEISIGDLQVSAEQEATWVDNGAAVGVDYFYRMTALDSGTPPNASQPSKPIVGRAVDTLPPGVPVLVSIKWVIHDAIAGISQPFPAPGNIPTGFKAAVSLEGKSNGYEVLAYRKTDGAELWSRVRGTEVMPDGSFAIIDGAAQIERNHVYRCAALNQAGMVSQYSEQLMISLPKED